MPTVRYNDRMPAPIYLDNSSTTPLGPLAPITGNATPVRTPESGFFVPGQARDIQRLRTPNGESYVVTRNNDRALVFRAARRATLHAAQ